MKAGNPLVEAAGLIAVLALWLSSSLQAGERAFVYGAAAQVSNVSNNDLIAGFNLRKHGEMYTTVSFRFSPDSRWRPLLEEKIKTDDLAYSYFEIITVDEIPKARGFPFPYFDIVTDEVRADLAENFKWRRERGLDREEIFSEAMIVSLRVITQNEYLHVTPKIVPDPAKGK